MPINDILNKVAYKEAIGDQEYSELGAWVQKYPTAAPVVNQPEAGDLDSGAPNHTDPSKRGFDPQ